MLSKEELSRYGTATLTSVFLDRVFQECLTYDGEMVQSNAVHIQYIQMGDKLKGQLQGSSSFILQVSGTLLESSGV